MYRYRNRDIRKRPFRMIARGLGSLVVEDFRQLFSSEFPGLTVSIPYGVLRAYYRLRRQQVTLSDFESVVAKCFVRSIFHRRAQGRPVVFAITRILSFAKDIDTQAELAEACVSSPCVSD
jgi:hypothetical protein